MTYILIKKVITMEHCIILIYLAVFIICATIFDKIAFKIGLAYNYVDFEFKTKNLLVL